MEQQRYIEQYQQREGIRLEPERIEENPVLRFVGKQLMNSLYGKFGQRPARQEVRVTSTADEFNALTEDDTLDIIDIEHMNEHVDRLVTRTKQEHAPAARTNCLPIAVYITAYARLRLLHYLEETDRVGAIRLYCDTDSCWMVVRAGQRERVAEGEFLGEMKREYADRRIVEFICAGPKNYGFRHVDRATGQDERAEAKIRGFCLNYLGSRVVHFQRMLRLIRAAFDLQE